jgi:hypothetical protein
MLATDTQCAQRLHDLAWQCQRGDFAALRRLLAAQGRQVTVDASGLQLTVQGPPCTVGILAGSDPLSCFIQVAFALFGAWWPFVPCVRQAMAQVKTTWHAQTQARRQAPRPG